MQEAIDIVSQLNDGTHIIMGFERGLDFAAGKKSLYFSARRAGLDFDGKTSVKHIEGINYINPSISRSGEIVEAKIIRPDLVSDNRTRESATRENRNFGCALPMALAYKEHKNISAITDEEARQAGYGAAPNRLRLMLALQGDTDDAFQARLAERAQPVLRGLYNHLAQSTATVHASAQSGTDTGGGSASVASTGNADIQQQVNLAANLAIQFIKKGIDTSILKDESNAHNVKSIIDYLVSIVPATDIPGTTDIYSVHVPTPQEMAGCNGCDKEDETKRKLAESLRYFVEEINLRPLGLNSLNLRDNLERNYTRDELNTILKGLSNRANELDPPQEKPNTRITLQNKIEAAPLSGHERSLLRIDLAKAGEDEDRLRGIRDRLEQRLADQSPTAKAR